MSSIVLDLQNEITKSDCDIVNVLRKAHLIAVKLNLTEFDKWICSELNGYKGEDEIPDYREIFGSLKAFNPYRGWIPVVIDNAEFEKQVCFGKCNNSISEIIGLNANNENGIVMDLLGETRAMLNKNDSSPFTTQYRLEFSPTAVGDIIEKVKNTVLEWTIKLEAEGILGEGMQFNSSEKDSAKRIPQTVNNYYGNTNVINSPLENTAVIAGDGSTVRFSYDAAQDAVAEIESSLETDDLSPEDKETVMEMLEDIKEKLEQKKKPTLIKSVLVGLKDFLIGAGASATVALIQAKMQGLF